MTALPAYCSNCDLLFPFVTSTTGAQGLSFSGSGAACPKCGGSAQILDGMFDVYDDVISIVQAPWATFELLSRFVEALGNARASGKDSDEVAIEVEQVHPELGRFVRAAFPKIHRWSPLLLGILLALHSCGPTTTVTAEVDVNKLIDQIQTMLRAAGARHDNNPG